MRKMRFWCCLIAVCVVFALSMPAVTARAQQPTAIAEGVTVEVLERESADVAAASLDETYPTALAEGVSVEVLEWEEHAVEAVTEETQTADIPTALGEGFSVEVLEWEAPMVDAVFPEERISRPAVLAESVALEILTREEAPVQPRGGGAPGTEGQLPQTGVHYGVIPGLLALGMALTCLGACWSGKKQ